MNIGFVKVLLSFYSLFEEGVKFSDEENFQHYDKKGLMLKVQNFVEMFNLDLESKPVTIVFDQKSDFDRALIKIMRMHQIDKEEIVVQDGPNYILSTPFYQDIYSGLLKKKGSELLPIIRKINGNFSFEICLASTSEILCTGSGNNGVFNFKIKELNVSLPKSLSDLYSFGYDLQILLEISKDFDFIFNNVSININD